MRSSSWQQKYGGDKQQDNAADENDSLNEWISAVQDRANAEASSAVVPETYYDEFVPNNSVPTDNEADAIINEMNKLLDDGLSTTSDNNNNSNAFDFNEVDFHNDTTFNIHDEQQQIDFNEEDYSKYLQLSSIEEDPVFSSSELTIDIREEVAVLFRRTNDQKMLKKCFDILVVHARDSKLLRASVFACWKLITRRNNNTKDQLVRRFRRRHRLRYMRRILKAWLDISGEKTTLLLRAIERRDCRTKSKVFAILHTRYKHVQELNDTADKFYQSRLKRQLFVGWLASSKTVDLSSPSNKDSNLQESEQGDYKARAAIIEDDHEEDVDPSKLSAIKCITPEKKVVQLSQPRSQASEKENNQPNKEQDRQLLQPLKPQRKPIRNTGTPKLLIKMNQRKKERERQREILQQRYEQKAIERKHQLQQEQLRREEAEMRYHREHLQNKAAEEHKKKLAAARNKQANRLAVLHYRMSLQKRLLLQWKKIFKIKSFNERKAIMAWRDTVLEKSWQNWIMYTAEEQAKRKALELKQEISSDVFNRRRLLAKSFASLEEHCHYTQSLVEEAQQRFITHKQRRILKMWLRVTVKAQKTRRKREKKAAKHGRRLLLLRAIQYWQVGVKISKKEHEVDMLVKAKWEEVEKWLR